MKNKKATFALFFSNRGFFPASLQTGARRELTASLKKLGYETISLDPKATNHGAVETPQEGKIYAEFLRQNRGRFQGVILCLPNFGDETGAIAALKDCGVPILIQAYGDELDKMGTASRRDAFCGKFSVMDVFCQYGLPFTIQEPHTVHPLSDVFAANVDYFDRLCRVVAGMKDITIGAIGARTTPFKTVRIDESALQRYGVTTETFDLSAVFAQVKALRSTNSKVKAKVQRLRDFTSWRAVPRKAFENLAKLGVVLDEMIEQYDLDAIAIRCWTEMQTELGISPCVLLGELNERGIPAACEVDVGSAMTMHALSLASGKAAACLDWNNNYGEHRDKCIIFHCGPVPSSMMAGKGRIIDHGILNKAVGKGRAFGCNVGRIKPTPMTFGNTMTQAGKIKVYLGQGRFTKDPIPKAFFGCAGVVQIPDLQNVLRTIGYAGHRHHVTVTPGHVLEPVREAFEKYLGYEVTAV
ncbi:MAG: hypothetical protein SVT52_03965 [Planctomycetota bacterium]|nr:hypothetical protein [Planctomycetota bacterium]